MIVLMMRGGESLAKLPWFYLLSKPSESKDGERRHPTPSLVLVRRDLGGSWHCMLYGDM